jgi:beta-lactamase regulating signal transducer with metallopeptidase domain
MNAVIELVNQVADRWVDGIWSVIWQTAILAGVVFLLTLCFRRMSPAARFWLWMLVPLRLLVMPLMTVTLPLLPAAQATLKPADALTVGPGIAVKMPAGSPGASTVDLALAPVLSEASDVNSSSPVVRPTIWTGIMAMWLIGVGVFAVRFIIERRRVKQIVAHANEARDCAVLTAARGTAERLALREVPRIVLTRTNVSPFVCGVWRPTVVLPRMLVDRISSEELLAVLSHEFAHVQRRDILVGWAVTLCEVVYFFHPAFQIAKRGLMLERERACDERVLVYGQTKRNVYGRGLIAAAEVCRGFASGMSSVPEIAETFGDLKKRVTFICSDRQPRAHLSRSVAVILTLFTLLCLPRVVLTARGAPSPPDLRFTREIAEKLAELDIDKATREDVITIFGKPLEYRWEQEVLKENDLPVRYVMCYPNRFEILVFADKVIEVRHHEPGYAFRDTLQVGSSLEEVLKVVGPPTTTIEGEPNAFKDGVLYKDIDGQKGYCYYARSDQNGGCPACR